MGTEAAQDRWMEEKLEGWKSLVAIIAVVVGKHPQTTYAGLQKSLQQEWDFVQHVTPYIGTSLHTMEDSLRDAFLLDLFKGYTSYIPGREFTSLPVKQDMLALPDTTQTAGAN